MNEMDLSYKASQIRSLFGVENEGPIDVFSLINNQKEITLVLMPFASNFSGMCIKEAKLIAVNSAQSLGRQRFSLAHELYHYYFDDSKIYQPTSIHISYDDKNSNEKEANLFASLLLMPYASLKKEIEKLNKTAFNLEDTIHLEQYFQVSHLAMTTRLESLGYRFTEDVTKYIKSTAERLGYNTDLYEPTNIQKTLGNYIFKVNDLYSKELISNGKYQEYLKDAFREESDFDLGGDKEYD